MAEKKVQPLFKPKIDSEVDLSNIDRAFTREDPKETPSDPALKKHLLTEKFDQFTFLENKLGNEN